MRDGVTVTYSVCIGGAGIDYSSVTSILYTYYAFHHPAVLHQWVRARLAQVSATRQRYRCHRFGTLLRWGIRFLSGIRLSCFDYSRVTRVRVLLTFYPTSLSSLRILASLSVTHCDSLLLAYPHVFLTCGTFLEFVGCFLLVRATVALASIATTIIAPILLLALRSTALLAVFFRILRFSR